MIIPDKTIVAIPLKHSDEMAPFDMKQLHEIITPLNKSRKREWFHSDFYKCLPLSIANMQGFAVSVPFDFEVMWNGGDSTEDLFFKFYEDEKKYNKILHVSVSSHFGRGIFTVNLPVILKTPDKVNLMTISPPNFLTPGLNTMSGVIESDNLRYSFTLNVKVNIPNVWIRVPSGTPIAAIIPIPRYFCDDFSLVDASEIIEKKYVDEERSVAYEHRIVRDFLFNNFPDSSSMLDRTYFFGTDIRGNKFSDHQLPVEKK